MKKLLVLVAILSLATVANAALLTNLSVSVSDTELFMNDTATISFISNSTDTGTVYLDIANYAQKDIQFSLTNSAVTSNAGDMGSVDLGTVYDPVWEYMIQVAASPTGTVTAGTMYNVTLTNLVGLGDDVVVTLIDENLGQVGDAITVQLIPEPITLALLGLGGLFIRRK